MFIKIPQKCLFGKFLALINIIITIIIIIIAIVHIVHQSVLR